MQDGNMKLVVVVVALVVVVSASVFFFSLRHKNNDSGSEGEENLRVRNTEADPDEGAMTNVEKLIDIEERAKKAKEKAEMLKTKLETVLSHPILKLDEANIRALQDLKLKHSNKMNEDYILLKNKGLSVKKNFIDFDGKRALVADDSNWGLAHSVGYWSWQGTGEGFDQFDPDVTS